MRHRRRLCNGIEPPRPPVTEVRERAFAASSWPGGGRHPAACAMSRSLIACAAASRADVQDSDMTDLLPMPPREEVVVWAELRDGSRIDSPAQFPVIADTQKHRLLGRETSRAYERPEDFGWLPEGFTFDCVVNAGVILLSE